MPNIDFVGKRSFFIYLSIALILFSVIVIFVKGFNLGVDFSGGSEIIVSFDKSYTIDELRNGLQTINPEYATAKIIQTNPGGGASDRFFYIITVRDSFPTLEEKQMFINSLEESFSDSSLNIEQFNDVSGYAAREIRSYAWYAVIISLIVLLAYITIRFQFSYGVGAILALAHDVIITLGFYSLFGIEMNLTAIAAFLTLAGYSLNDTIVVYDRIRENRSKNRGMDIESITNKSINEVIVRSLNTSLTTFLVVFMMFLLGGRSIASFAFGLTVGVVIGTYSSLYIASPIVIGMVKRRKKTQKA
ncbi:preprotein translocase subunit SecF [Petrotoga sp. HKA.pet.4.5]|uniref:protein translocase subunit SecF n=1 Tax=unclassified Petrotoga TaxID=2620614 RepID=UPI000EF15F2A|nr:MULTISPECIES: protein translocase subunit SecF [unclassified Petrotoga]RLL82809.1 preprotein translocase subunit SecF [Petrotoga sp. Shatin.DS.tank11.9.2.9.3]RLL89394.1 preprotein translocase subunit SecF [Petrotoga sp. HKA.pet.4.5]